MTQAAAPSDVQQAGALAPVVAASTAAGVAAALVVVAGVSLPVATAVVASVGIEAVPSVVGPASQAVRVAERSYRAAYLVAAARRVQAAVRSGSSLRAALAAERPNLMAHLAAQANRRQAALAVDKAAARHGLLLGWRARMDSRTSAECAAADGKNFDVRRPPAIGWPGSVHPHCRCRPVAAFAGAPMVGETVRTQRKVAVA